MTFKFPRCTGKPQGVLYKKQQPPCPSTNIIWPAYIITTNTGTLYFDFQGMPMISHSAWVLREIPITLHKILSQQTFKKLKFQENWPPQTISMF